MVLTQGVIHSIYHCVHLHDQSQTLIASPHTGMSAGGMSAAKHKHPPHQGSKRSGDEWADIGAQAHRLDPDYDTYDEESVNDEASGPGSGWGSASTVEFRILYSYPLCCVSLG